MIEMRCPKCPNGGLRIVRYPYAECIWPWNLDFQGCGALYRLDDDAGGTAEVEVSQPPGPSPFVASHNTTWGGRFNGNIELGPVAITADLSAWQVQGALTTFQYSPALDGNRVFQRMKQMRELPDWGETA